MNIPPIKLSDYTYNLPDEKIAIYPTESREGAKLLMYQTGKITHQKFTQLPDLLPDDALLFFNDTKVIPARFTFSKVTGASIEIFLLRPVQPSAELSISLSTTEKVTWACTIGNLKRWPDNLTLQMEVGSINLFARLMDRPTCGVEFSWTPEHLTFSEIIQAAGHVPLPPYLRREAEEADKERYQTVYSQVKGAVAAPTAGLHFSDELLKKLKSNKVLMDFLTLHVSAGTFLPIKTENVIEHPMHAEQIIIQRKNIESLLMPGRRVIAVGTTSMRTLESLYWLGAKLTADPKAAFEVDQFLPYRPHGQLPSLEESLTQVLRSMDHSGVDSLVGTTSIYIYPGYEFRICRGLITNFHQPGSTLLLLIAAFVGPNWKKIYEEALAQDYRFLSYGDSSLLLP